VWNVLGCPGSGQFFRTIVSDCDGNTIEVIDTDLNGDPIEVTGTVGQCVGGGTVPIPCGDIEVVTLCDARPDGTVVPFLQHMRYTCSGGLASVSQTNLDGDEAFEPEGVVTVCGDLAEESPGPECVHCQTLLLCDDRGDRLAEPPAVGFLTCAAPNRRMIERNGVESAEGVPGVLAARARGVLAVAAHHGVGVLVLGAWGCGVFGNRPPEVAAAFAEHLHGDYAGVFERVVFAVLDRDGGVREAFDDRFPGPAGA
jgi:hypothetical protein